MTIEELTARLVYWQGLLRLQDWHIEVRFATWHEVGDAADAHVNWNDFERDAEITVIEEAHYYAPKFGRRKAYDPEFYLLHELLHLVLVRWDTKRDTLEDLAQEQAINHLAGALLSLDRQGQPLLEESAARIEEEPAQAFGAE